MCSFFNYSDLIVLASILSPVKLKIRESHHSFSGYVLEVHFSDDFALDAVWLASEIRTLTGQFIALRIYSESQAYLSIPVDPDSVPF